MQRLFAETRLGRAVRNACAEYRSVRMAEHRASLRLKRAAVRSRVLYEVQRAELEQAVLNMEAARSAISMQAARNVLSAEEGRRAAVRSAAAEKGEVLPRAASAGEVRERLVRGVEGLIPEGAGGVAGGKIASEVLRESVEAVELEGGDAGSMGVRIVADVAKQAGVSREQMEILLGKIDGGADPELRERVLAEMEAGQKKEKM